MEYEDMEPGESTYIGETDTINARICALDMALRHTNAGHTASEVTDTARTFLAFLQGV